MNKLGLLNLISFFYFRNQPSNPQTSLALILFGLDNFMIKFTMKNLIINYFIMLFLRAIIYLFTDWIPVKPILSLILNFLSCHFSHLYWIRIFINCLNFI